MTKIRDDDDDLGFRAPLDENPCYDGSVNIQERLTDQLAPSSRHSPISLSFTSFPPSLPLSSPYSGALSALPPPRRRRRRRRRRWWRGRGRLSVRQLLSLRRRQGRPTPLEAREHRTAVQVVTRLPRVLRAGESGGGGGGGGERGEYGEISVSVM